MIPWLASLYSTLQSSPRYSTDVGQWNGWQWYESPYWNWINILYWSTFWSYLTTSPLKSCPQSSSICARNHCPKFAIPKSYDQSLSELIWYYCKLRGLEILENDLPIVIQGWNMACSDNAQGVKYWLCENFTIYWQQIVGWKLSQSQYHTSIEGQDMTVSAAYSRGWYTGYCGSASVECSRLCW